ncbi:MAG: sialate O-acetylesterase [Treponema sp.]|jgi:alpha-L-fucosidase 2|nr:sialate O-acetylesterase [Treponema sp.]
MKKQENGAVFSTQDEKHLYIAFGQSNMQGPGAIRESDTQNISGRWQTLNVVAGTYASVNRAKSQWYKAPPPLIIPDGNLTNYLGLSTGLGPSDHFGRIMTTGAPENITIGVVAVANGDLALSSFRKTLGAAYFAAGQGGTVDGIARTANRPSDTERQGWTRYIGAGYASIYDAIVRNVNLAQSQGWIVKGIIFHQGESGGGLEDKTWVEMLKEIYDDILTGIGIAANSIPIICGQLYGGGQVAVSTGNDGGAALGNMLHTDNRIQNTIPNAWVISSNGCGGRTGNQQPDGIHFGSEGIQLLGVRYGQKMLELVYGSRLGILPYS